MTPFARNTFWKRLFLFGSVVAAAILSACTTLPTPSANYDSSKRIVIPVVPTGPATIDGVPNEAAWTGSSFKFPMVHGGGPTTTFFRGVADATNIYLYTEVDDPKFDPSDVLVIGLNPSNGANDYRRFHIFPCLNVCADNGSNEVALIQYWQGGSHNGMTWTWGNQLGAPAGMEAKVATATGGTKSWAVEVKVPRGAEFVDSNFFGLFVDVVRIDPDLVQATQFTWPPNLLIGDPDENSVLSDVVTGTPPPSKWGNATLNTGFGSGVSIYGNDITSNHGTDGSLIRLNAPNTFFATASNFTSTGGTLVPANAVKANFKIANFGIGGGYVPVPGSGNPAGPTDIPAASANTFSTGTWSLSGSEVTQYTAHPHQCIQVELTSTDMNTVIVTPSAQRNMDFVTAGSPFRESAVVTTKGLERTGDRKVAFTLRESFVNFDPRLTWTTKIENAVPAGKRVYRTEVAPASDLTLGVTVDPPRIKIPSEAVRIPPGTGGERNPAVKVAVRPGDVVTIISSGSIDIEGQPMTAAGQPMKDRRGEPRIRTAGARRIGALIGSFDEFKVSAFVIGNASTFKVPGSAQTLFLKINDDPNQYAGHKGEGYGLQVIRTPMEPWMVASNPELAREVRGDDVLVTLGANLPTWQLRGERDSGKFIRIGNKTFRAYESAGSYGHMVREIK